MRTTYLLIAFLLTGCQTTESRDERIKHEHRPYLGGTLLSFMQATGEMPGASYDTRDGHRHFVFQESRPVISPGFQAGNFIVPTMSGVASCSRSVETKRTAPTETPDAFTIISITVNGVC